MRETRGGTRSVSVDLAEVTHLASAAVQVLYEAASRAAREGSELVLYAPAGSVARHVLSLVALPHTTTGPDVEAAAEPPG
ncbi:MAG: STAS domain-containing protein [Trebonia sp.]